MPLFTDTFSPGKPGRMLPLFSVGATMMPRTRTSTSPCLAWAGAAASAVPMAPIAATIIIFFKCMSFLHP